MTRPPQPARILRSLPTSRLPGGIAHATVAGVAFSPTATALAYLSFPASDRTTARDGRMRTAVLAWELFVHHGFRDGVHRQFVTGHLTDDELAEGRNGCGRGSSNGSQTGRPLELSPLPLSELQHARGRQR